MKPRLRNLSNMSSRQKAVGRRQQAETRRQWLILLPTTVCLLLTGLTGCESLQRKFTRRSKQPKPLPTPIISFQDYTRAMTPLDRYRKHYMLFDYWNDDLMESLQSPPQNPKRFKLASREALAELETLKGLLVEELAVRLDPLIEERARLDRRLQSGAFNTSEASAVTRILETQTRQLQRDFFWRDVQDHLKSAEPSHDAPAR